MTEILTKKKFEITLDEVMQNEYWEDMREIEEYVKR